MHKNIAPSISKDAALDMVASQIVTEPVFSAIFGSEFREVNPIAKGLDTFIASLPSFAAETKALEPLYKSVAEKMSLYPSSSSRQNLIHSLYESFLEKAFEKEVKKYGVVYTPVEIVDFILRATDATLKRFFATSFDEKGVTIYDPFTGTGSFIKRLLSEDLGLISDANYADKFANEIYAEDIMLLAYYIALTNISQARSVESHSKVESKIDSTKIDSTLESKKNETPMFSNIILGDSLDYLDRESEDKYSDDKESLFARQYDASLSANEHLLAELREKEIRVIIGNPPYSAGQKSANELNANIVHTELEADILNSWGKLSASKNAGQTSRDSYIQAFRVSDLMIKKQGVVSFVTNSGFLRAAGADGVRKGLANDFDKIMIVDLLGDQRDYTNFHIQGERMFPNVQVGACVIFLAKNKDLAETDKGIFYHRVADGMKRDEKLAYLESLNINEIEFERIVPNEAGDWLNQRDTSFDNLMPLMEQGGIFELESNGIQTNRDGFVIDFNKKDLEDHVSTLIDTYNSDLASFDKAAFMAGINGGGGKGQEY